MILAFAMALDAILGEPRWLWSRVTHPIVAIGNIIGWADNAFNRGQFKTAKGILCIFLLCILAGFLGYLVAQLGWVVQGLIAAILLAQKSLAEHVSKVAIGLRTSLDQGKSEVAMIVGRDTSEMGPSDVARAAIESAAENFSDGVVAPAFWFVCGGLPGILIYKVVNTADSMIGYRTPKHKEFGWASARLDDVLNWVPARLTAVAFLAAGWLWAIWPEARADAKLHRSPNAGWPEAVLSRIIGVSVSGPRMYQGTMQSYAWVNRTGRKDANAEDIDAAVRVLWKAWGMMVITSATVGLIAALAV